MKFRKGLDNEICEQSQGQYLLEAQIQVQTVKGKGRHSPQRKTPKKKINPYLFFHSPNDESKSSFVDKKQQLDAAVDNQAFKQGLKRYERQQVYKTVNLNLTFTDELSNERRKNKMGMLMVTKLQWITGARLAYCPQQRSVIKVPQCQNCGKVFEGHQAMGGHKRLCRLKKK